MVETYYVFIIQPNFYFITINNFKVMETAKTLIYFFSLFIYVLSLMAAIIYAIVSKQWWQLVSILVLIGFSFFKVKEMYKYLTRNYGTNNRNNNK